MIEHVSVVGVPSSAGAYAPGQEKAPQALRDAGLLEALEETEATVTDRGDSDRVRWRPDRADRRAQNSNEVLAVVRETAERVEAALSEGTFPLVLGGDCTVGLGTVAGTVSVRDHVGWLYFDLHPDLNTPHSTDDGALDWMGVAHALGEPRTVESLSHAGPRFPLLQYEDVFFFSYGPDHRTAWETSVMERHDLAGIPVDEVASRPEATAEEALRTFASQVDNLVVHFDVDTVDFVDLPLSENTGRNQGLAFAQAMRALGSLLDCDSTCALTITEVNPDHGTEDGGTLERFVDGLASVLA